MNVVQIYILTEINDISHLGCMQTSIYGRKTALSWNPRTTEWIICMNYLAHNFFLNIIF